ncbi:MAG: carboxypeptidase regulatory-like domain-containing protein [Anaerolineae bacterium]
MGYRRAVLIGLLIIIVLISSSFANALPFTQTSVLSFTTTTAWPCQLPGDLDCDCDVDIADITLVASIWHTAVGDDDYDPDYDLDDNGKVDIVDIMLVAVHWGETCEVVSFQISASSDDALDTYDGGNSAYSHTKNAMNVGHAGTGGTFQGPVHTGFRFANVTVPSGSIIVTATLRLKNKTERSDAVHLKLAAHDADNGPTFADTAGGRPSGRTPTSAQVDWDISSAWQAEAWYESPDVASVVQEVVDRPGWEAGQALSIIVRDDGSDSGQRRRVYAYDSDPANAAQLVVSYRPPSSGTPTPTPTSTATPTPGTPTPTPTPTSTLVPGQAQIWAAGNTRKVLPTDPVEGANYVWSGAGRSVGIKAARNEHEPFQLIIATDSDPLSGVNVTASDLSGPGGIISQDNITLYRQTYFEVTQPSDPWELGLPIAIIPPGRIPDALIPFDDPYDPGHAVGAPFAVSVGENQPIWVDLYVPTDAAPGEYSGTLTITADGGATVLDTITLNLTVWDFALPETTSLDAYFPLDTFWTLPPQYEINEGNEAALYTLTDKYYEALLDHRLHPYEFYQRPAYSEAGGTVQLDFSASDPQYEYFLDTRGAASFNLPGVFDEDVDKYLIRDASGKRYTAAAFDDPVFTDKAAQYYQLLRDHFTAQGWFDRHFTYFVDETEWVSDEPLHNGPEGLQRLLDWATLVKGVDPAFKVVAASVYPIPPGPPDRGWVDLVGYVDWWSIASDEVEQDPETYRQRVALGETLSLYFNDYGDFIDYKATLHRALGSLAYKYDAAALEGWAVAAWVGDANSMNIINPWLGIPDPVYGNGAGALFWPGHKIEGDPTAEVDGPLPSIRLELAREAAEDYEYLVMLATQTSEAFARGLAINLLPQFLRDADPDPADFYTFRDLMGEILSGQHPVNLATIQGTVTDSGSGAPLAGVLVSNGQGAALTEGDGTYELAVEAGAQTLTASRDRYTSAQQAVTVGAGATLTVDFFLERVAEESTLLFSFETAGEVADWEFDSGISWERTSQHATERVYSLKTVFGDSKLSAMGTWQFPTDWSSFTALEFDVYNESDYYTYFYVGVGDNAGGWYPLTGGDILLLPNASKHVVVPIAEMAHDVDVSDVEWLEFEPETIAEEENYKGKTRTYPLGPRTLYFDNLRLVRVVGSP